MVKRKGVVTKAVIRKVHNLLVDVDTGEEIMDFLRATEPVFMQEVGRFVEIEQDNISEDLQGDEDLMMHICSILGAAYLMGFLIAREQFHSMYNELVDLDGVLDEIERSKGTNNVMDKKEETGCKVIEEKPYDDPYAIFHQSPYEEEEYEPTEEEWKEIQDLIRQEEIEEEREKKRRLQSRKNFIREFGKELPDN